MLPVFISATRLLSLQQSYKASRSFLVAYSSLPKSGSGEGGVDAASAVAAATAAPAVDAGSEASSAALGTSGQDSTAASGSTEAVTGSSAGGEVDTVRGSAGSSASMGVGVGASESGGGSGVGSRSKLKEAWRIAKGDGKPGDALSGAAAGAGVAMPSSSSSSSSSVGGSSSDAAISGASAREAQAALARLARALNVLTGERRGSRQRTRLFNGLGAAQWLRTRLVCGGMLLSEHSKPASASCGRGSGGSGILRAPPRPPIQALPRALAALVAARAASPPPPPPLAHAYDV